MANSWRAPYDTGWINRSDWTNVHMGSNTTLNVDSNVAHNLNAPLSQLLVKILLSTDGTDANSFEITLTQTGADRGISISQVDNNNILVHTHTSGFTITDNTGANVIIDTEDWYYKIKVWFLG